MQLRGLLWATGLAMVLSRLAVILSAPPALSPYDEATWKHGWLALQLQEGGWPGAEALARQAWHSFNYHQVAWLPYNLLYAGLAQVVGHGFVQLHCFDALFALVGALAWVSLLHRHGGARAAHIVALLQVCAPMPALLLGLRPWSGHVEAWSVAVLALALGPARPLAMGLCAGAALSLSPLCLPLLTASALAALPELRAHPPGAGTLLRAAAGLCLGLSPYALRAAFAPTAFLEAPVLEDPGSTALSILGGDFGPGLAALWPPTPLVWHAASIPAAHSASGLPAGDAPLVHLAIGLALIGLLFSPPPRGWLRRTLLLAGPLLFGFIALCAPDRPLRYLYGLYPLAAAALALAAEGPGRLPRLAPLLLLVVLPPALRDLYATIDLSRAGHAWRYRPDRLMVAVGLEAAPPPELWPLTEALLEPRRHGGPDATGLAAPWRPLDHQSAAGWQVLPPPSPETTAHALALVRNQLQGGAEQPLRNLGLGLCISVRFDEAAFRALLPSPPPPELPLLEQGCQQGRLALEQLPAALRGPAGGPPAGTVPDRALR